MSSGNIERAQVLLQQNRPTEAEDYARKAIEEDVNRPLPYVILASSLDEQNKHKDALPPIQEAIRLSPEWDYAHFRLAGIYYSLRDWKKSEASLNEALRLNPDNPDAYGLLAYLRIRSSKWEEALSFAERGLQIDSDHVTCTNARAHALSNLKRSDQATDSLDYALQRDPDNPYTHFQKGQVLLRAGNYDQAAHHFCEALRLEPNFAEAREGLVQALKGKHFIYSIFLKYTFFMMRLTPGARWGIILGGLFGHRFLFSILAESGHITAAYAVRILYGAIVFFTWNASSVFNLLLLSHPLGRHALSDTQKRVSALVGLVTLAAIGFVVAFFYTYHEIHLLSAICMLLITLPLSALEHTSRPNRRKGVIAIAAGQAIATLVALILYYNGQTDIAGGLLTLTLLAGAAFSWLSGFFTD
ncbi:MAG: tetratricopeptide repeat protein [Verrucomicrobiota bacterium]